MGYKPEMQTVSSKNNVLEYNNKKEMFIPLSSGLLNCAALTHKDNATFNVTGLGEEESPRYL
jgi:hypothetical protein